ncbi:unnamed protein product [Medioppia subpectinata]|uniref:limulus clotting factor C n=1 Tax=Medioppia subpectinata TaxID=1979941 RepID=A0A7R9KUU2_9ACAR|nr:unnamed protein product [Medioppia subpectinata]CAG2108900.1 unnamed protein product [Medioppia subpectinata]
MTFSIEYNRMALIAAVFTLCLASSYGYAFGGRQQCGRSMASTRIVGGQAAQWLAWPWMGFIEYNMTHPTKGLYIGICSGSLISDQWVLTAAHCTEKIMDGYKIIGINVTFGDYDFRITEGTEVTRFVNQYYLDSFNGTSFKNDLALYKLTEPLDLQGQHSYLQPICMPPRTLNLAPGTMVEATGWGYTSDTSGPPDTLNQIALPVVNNPVCKRRWDYLFDASGQLCAGYQEAGHNICHGDSGGPLNYQLANGAWVVYGLTSFTSGDGCATYDSPSVFTKVAPYISWIERVTGLKFN